MYLMTTGEGTYLLVLNVPDDPALLPVLVGEEAPELGIENIAARVCDRDNVAHLEELALNM